jgi:hypothetical protein
MPHGISPTRKPGRPRLQRILELNWVICYATRTMAYARPTLLERMVARLVEATVRYPSAQTDASADTVVLLSPFDPSRATASSSP